MTTELATVQPQEPPAVPMDVSIGALEAAIGLGDFSKLNPGDRLKYVAAICKTVGLNPLTKPFDYITLQGKLILYANKGCAEQLRALHRVSVRVLDRRFENGCCIVQVRATTPDGREDESLGVVPSTLPGGRELAGADWANAVMKAETKAKRRATLSICGLGMPDVSELETVRDKREVVGDIVGQETVADAAHQITAAITDQPEPNGSEPTTATTTEADTAPILDDIVRELRRLVPGMGTEDKRRKADYMQEAFECRSWSIIQAMQASKLTDGLKVLRATEPDSTPAVSQPATGHEPAREKQPEPRQATAPSEPDASQTAAGVDPIIAAVGVANLAAAVTWMLRNNWITSEQSMADNPFAGLSEANRQKILTAPARFLRAIGVAK